jgi:uncharacterized protein (DUF3820 family)
MYWPSLIEAGLFYKKRSSMGRYTGSLSRTEVEKRLKEHIYPSHHTGNERIFFGKYRGYKYKDLPDDYLDWLAQKFVAPYHALCEIKIRMELPC